MMRDTPTRWYHGRALWTAITLIVMPVLTSCTSERHDGDLSRPHADTPQSQATVSEIPSDSRLASALGVMMRTLEVRHPPSMKLSVTKRVYRDGVLDSTMSSRQVHGSTRPVGNCYLSLGWLDPDATTSEPQGKLKVFGSGGTIWIKKPAGRNFGGFIDVPTTGEIAIGKQQLVMELAYGAGTPRSSLGLGTEEIREGATIRVTLHVLVEPLSEEEQQELTKHSNFTKAFKVDE